MKYISKSLAKQLGDYFHINWKIVNFNSWHKGLNIELEHGSKNPITNITNDDPLMTAKIALAHIMEFPNYYEYLIQMENQLKEDMKRK